MRLSCSERLARGTHDLVVGMLRTTALNPMAHLICGVRGETFRRRLAERETGSLSIGISNAAAQRIPRADRPSADVSLSVSLAATHAELVYTSR